MVRHFRHFGFQRCRSFGPIRINFRSTDLTEEDMNGRCDIHVKGLHVSKGETGLPWSKSSLWKAPANVTQDCRNFCNHPMIRSDEHTSELQSLMSNSYALFRLKKNNK